MTSHNNVKQTVRKRSTVVSNEAASSQEAASLYDASQIQDRHKKHTNDLIRAVLNGDIYAILEMFSESLQIGKESLQWAKPINTNQTSNPFTRLGKDHIDGIWPLSAKPGRLAVFSDLSPEADGTVRQLAQMVAGNDLPGYQCELVCCERLAGANAAPWPTEGKVVLPGVRETNSDETAGNTGVPSILDVMAYFEQSPISLVHVATPGPLGISALVVARMKNIPVVIQFHGEFISQATSLLQVLMPAPLLQSVWALIYQQADCVLVTSEQEYQRCLAVLKSPDAIQHIPYMADTTLFSPPEKKANRQYWSTSGDSVRVVCYLNEDNLEKNRLLMSVFNLLWQHHIHTEQIILLSKTSTNLTPRESDGFEHTLIANNAELEDRACLLACADIFVFFEDDNFVANPVLEAQASGLPCISVSDTGNSQWVDNDVNGFIMSANDELLAAAIARMAQDVELRKGFGACARKRALRQTNDVASHEYLSLYNRLLETVSHRQETNEANNDVRLFLNHYDASPWGQITG